MRLQSGGVEPERLGRGDGVERTRSRRAARSVDLSQPTDNGCGPGLGSGRINSESQQQRPTAKANS